MVFLLFLVTKTAVITWLFKSCFCGAPVCVYKPGSAEKLKAEMSFAVENNPTRGSK